VITGFNTDIEHNGVVYHVQTEDKGLETPIILSLVYVGGAILASKRAPYEDLIAEGFSDEVLAERLKRQHRLICAAINSGRINDLKKMGAREDLGATVPPPPPQAPVEAIVPEEQTVVPPMEQPVEQDFAIVHEDDEIVHDEEVTQTEAPVSDTFDMELEDIPSQIWSPPEREETPPPPAEPEFVEQEFQDSAYNEAYSAHDQRAYGLREVSLEEGLSILLLDEEEFYSGQTRILRVLVVNRKDGDEKPLGSVAVSIKILGTTFRPLIYSLKTDRDGVASVTTQIPLFTSGRAAVLIRTVAKDQAAELRCVIHPTP
jgi:hypothetical protein